MIKTRVRKIIRDVWARKGRTTLVSLAIFIGVTGTIALFSMSDILIGQLKEDIKEDELAMVQIAAEVKEGEQPDNLAYAQRLIDYPGVTEIKIGLEERVVFFKTDPEDEDFEDGFAAAYQVLNEDGTALLEAPSQAAPAIEPYRLLEGGVWPERGQLLVERRMADKYDLDIGDELYMRILSPSRQPDRSGATGTVEAWTISGIVFAPYSLTPDSAIFTSVEDSLYLTGFVSVSDFWLRFTDFAVAEAEVGNIEDLLASETAYSPVFTQMENPAESQLITQAELFASLMSFLALVSLIVSGFLVVNVITSLVTEQKRQIGVMKSMGATRTDNFFIYSGIAFMYGVIGVIPGVLVGIPGGNAAAYALAPQLNTVLEGFQVSPTSVILGVVVGLLVPVIASLIPVFNGTRVQILEAMTDLGIDAHYGTGPMARLIAMLPIPITVRQGLSNVSLKKSRLAFTVITLSIAVGAFMGIFALFESLTDGIQIFFDSWNVHVGVFPSEPRDPVQMAETIENAVGDRINPVQSGFFQQIEFEGYDPQVGAGGPPAIFAYGIEADNEDPAFLFELTEGEGLTADNKADGIIMASLLAANMGKQVGDHVVMRVPGNSKEFTIVGIADFPIEQAWAQWDVLALLRDSTIDKITSASPLPADMLPPEASGFIKYMTLVDVDGYETETAGMFSGTMVMGFTPSIAQFFSFEAGGLFTVGEPGVLLTRELAAQGGFELGDMLTLTSQTPSGLTGEYPVVGIFELPAAMAESGMMPAEFIGMYWRDAAGLDDAQIETEPLPGGYFVTLKQDDPTVDEVDEVFDDINDVFAKEGIAITGFNFVELTEQVSQMFFTIQAILLAVAGLIALVGALGLLTTLSMSVFERQKEIGVMRSIGAGSATVAIQFLTEGLVVGIIAWIVGIPLMVLIQYALLDITGFNETFPFAFSMTAVMLGLVGMLVITTIASLWPSLGAARKTVSDILRYQ
ncbi:MAG: FtsX-like permease family protein [Anaerolineae bacterium]|nr:FtsX-like permease family protein [Anaerolineae bacterium]